MKDIATQLISGDFSSIWLILVVGALTLVSNYLGTRVTKTAEFKSLKEQFSTILDQQKSIASSIGSINHDFNIQATAFQIKLNHYEEKSIVAITSCYEGAIALRVSIMEFFETSKTDEDIERARQKIADFSTLLLTQTIWLPPPVLELFNDLHEELKRQTSVYLRTFRSLRKSATTDAVELEVIRQIQSDFFDLAVVLSERLADLGGQISDYIHATMQKASSQLSEVPPTDSHTPAT
ncbi:hypothetical protein [Metapseudomonas otitidis]|uniref:hypothetical protein n=1 Tax=Metapseudomonas otitidis TaxID=319939 RepID=UPI0008E65CD4|nr:hypothetical protein [Pseudomonas otitidis]SFA66553.1 hypothetical protein SAMN05216263_12247 [Pseudomonas otitidis]